MRGVEQINSYAHHGAHHEDDVEPLAGRAEVIVLWFLLTSVSTFNHNLNVIMSSLGPDGTLLWRLSGRTEV